MASSDSSVGKCETTADVHGVSVSPPNPTNIGACPRSSALLPELEGYAFGEKRKKKCH